MPFKKKPAGFNLRAFFWVALIMVARLGLPGQLKSDHQGKGHRHLTVRGLRRFPENIVRLVGQRQLVAHIIR